MQGRIGLGLALVAGLVAGPALGADQRDTVARKFGEAFAIAQLCPALGVDEHRMGAYVAALGLSVDKTFEAIVTIAQNRALTDLDGVAAADVCALGAARYGPQGTEGPGLLAGR